MTRCTRNKLLATLGLCVVMLAVASIPAMAQAIPASTQFDMTGYLQSATLDTAGDAHSGGKLMVNNHLVTVPRETIVILPANALTWEEIFDQNPSGIKTETGMALADSVKPHPAYEVQVVGNRVGDQYIAGLVYISQQGLNSGAGYINAIDYAKGIMYVGGPMGSQSGARVQINDPATVPCAAADLICSSNSPANAPGMTGRFSKGLTPDKRFTVDQDNPTIASGTGFPMCLPRQAPAAGVDDPLCPQGNRPAGQIKIQMNDSRVVPSLGFPDATKQAPFEVGDYIFYAGTLFNDASGDYISAHTISNNTAIYTWPGSNPAYISTEVTIVGTGGLTIIGAGEAAIRTKFEGMSTDPSRMVHLYGIDLNPATGATSDRDWGVIGVDPGAPGGAVKGRWRFRPPCTAAVATQKACSPPPAGTFLPPTREMRAVIEGAWVPGQTKTYANGLIAGQYHAPILEYIFPENLPGTPMVPNNFESMDFLALGGYASAAGTLVGQLNPWPGANAPAGPPPACTLPVANAGGPYTVANGGSVTLSGSATGSSPFTYAWTASAGAFSDATLASPVYTGPGAGIQQSLTLAVTGCGTTVQATTTVTENAAAAPTVNSIANQTVQTGNLVTLSATATGGGTISFQWTQTGGPAVVLTPTSGAAATINFTLSLAAGTVTPATLTFQVVATNAGGSSAPGTVTVTIKPQVDAISITSALYRISKQRLNLLVSDSVVGPNVTLTLQPYVTQGGTIFNPSVLGNTLTNVGNGSYQMVLVGAPEPACNPGGSSASPCSALPLTIKSNLGGTSAPTVITTRP